MVTLNSGWIELLSAVVIEDSANGEAWAQLGACYLETRQLPLALEALDRAVKANPDQAMAHYLLGTAWGSSEMSLTLPAAGA